MEPTVNEEVIPEVVGVDTPEVEAAPADEGDVQEAPVEEAPVEEVTDAEPVTE